MYVSLTEGFPMTVLESMSAGVPCRTSPTSAMFEFDNDKVLRDTLVVNELEDPNVIATALPKLLERKHELVPRMNLYVNWLNGKDLYKWDALYRRAGLFLLPIPPSQAICTSSTSVCEFNHARHPHQATRLPATQVELAVAAASMPGLPPRVVLKKLYVMNPID